MSNLIAIIERIAGYLVGVLAMITVGEAGLRYIFNSHIPDGFLIGQTMQGIAICWGIATATYADRHVTVDILWELASDGVKRAIDATAHTINFAFMALFGLAMSLKVFDIMKAGEISAELRIPIWIGYLVAAVGIVLAVLAAALRWWQVVTGKK